MREHEIDVIVVGGGQAALATGFYLRRTGLSYVLLDDQDGPGGAWRRSWESLRLFSPAQWSSLPGWLMPRGAGEYPTLQETLAYLAEYERRYALPIERPVRVTAVRDAGERLRVEADDARNGARSWLSRAVISATGTWARPVVPDIAGAELFRGRTLHSATYRGPGEFAGKRVIVVGAGNSGVQILADLADVASVTWAVRDTPRFLPDEVDGRYLFEQATVRYKALQEGRTPDPPRSLGDVVMVEPVRALRDRGMLQSTPMFTAFTETGVRWADGSESEVDAVIWATGFRPSLAHLEPLRVIRADGRVAINGNRSVAEPRLWLVGYGEWTGFASATLIGVGRTARAIAAEVAAELGENAGEPGVRR